MKNSWQIKKLDDLIEDEVIELTRGKVISRKDLDAHPGDFPVYSSAKENDGMFGSYGKYMFDEELITWSVDGGGRLFHRPRHKFSVTNVGGILRIKDNNIIDCRYLFYVLTFLHSQVIFDWVKKAHPSVIRQIYNDIPLPPLPEQKRIVKVLDEVFEGINKAKANAEKNLANAKELFESYLQGIFGTTDAHRLTQIKKGWAEKSLEEIGTITSSKRIYRREYIREGIPFYRIKEVKELANEKEITTDLYISEKRYTEIKDVFGVPKEGDILMTAVGTIGEIYVVKNDGRFYFKDGNVLWFKDFNSIDPYFLKFALMVFVETIKRLSIGAAYNALTIEKLEKYKIRIPPLPEQRAIVAKLDALAEQTKKLEAIYQQKLAGLEELKKSVLQKAFKGEI